jgi:hypothetical protein
MHLRHAAFVMVVKRYPVTNTHRLGRVSLVDGMGKDLFVG